MEHSSSIDKVAEKPVLIFWRKGEIQSVFIDASESVSSANLKRGLASLFQSAMVGEGVQERDASGLCNVTYRQLDTKIVEKRKTFCEQNSLPARKRHPNPLFDVKVTSTRNAIYEPLSQFLPYKVREEERHKMTLTARSDMGTIVTSERTLEMIDATDVKSVQADTLKQAVAAVLPGAREVNIELQLESSICPDSGCPTVGSKDIFGFHFELIHLRMTLHGLLTMTLFHAKTISTPKSIGRKFRNTGKFKIIFV